VIDTPSLHGIVLVGDAMGQALSERDGENKGERVAPASLIHYPNSSEALASALTERLAPGDRLLVKGSNTIFWSENFVEQLLNHLE
jgi:UDP-N-acetylmuramyl pentapeptide synthase